VHKPTLEAGNPAVIRRNVGSKAIKMVYNPGGSNPVKNIDVDEKDCNLFSISNSEVEELARQALNIEKHYQRPMDIEWARDGVDGRLYIVQARPETVQSRSGKVIERYKLKQKGPVLTEGRSIGSRIGAGTAKVIMSLDDMDKVQPGDVLVTDMTDPDWEPIMKRAAAIVTNRRPLSPRLSPLAASASTTSLASSRVRTKGIMISTLSSPISSRTYLSALHSSSQLALKSSEM